MLPTLAWWCVALAVDGGGGGGLPAFTLSDAAGKTFTERDLLGRGAVLVVTAPTVAQGDAQRQWNRELDRLEWAPGGPFYGFLEDLSQSWFPDFVLGEIRKQYDPPPVFLIDRTGGLREALGVPRGTTVVLVVDPQGAIRTVERGSPTRERAVAVWREARQLLDAAGSERPSDPPARPAPPPR